MPDSKVDEKNKIASAVYTIFDYNADFLEEHKALDEASCAQYHDNGRITWINVDGLVPADVEKLCGHYEVHPLVVEDILTINQRARMDEFGTIIYCVLPMVRFDELACKVELEQVSIVLGKDFVLSFQEEPEWDAFDPIRLHLRNNVSKLRSSGADYLCYSMIDLIVDGYFEVLEKLNDRIEQLEDQMLQSKRDFPLTQISILRREVMVMHRSILPVRETISAFVRSDSNLLNDKVIKYFRDVLNHIIQANDYADNDRDMLMNLQDLYMNQINLRMNEVMKIFTLVTTLLAPAAVISGIFGMNFDVIPLQHKHIGFFLSVGCMITIPALMLVFFKRKGWF